MCINSNRKKINFVIIGKPNSGKSTLFNKLLKKEISPTGETYGLTKEMFVKNFTFNNIDFIIHDTPGLRRKNKVLNKDEESRNKKVVQLLEIIDIAILLIDSTESITKQDLKIADTIMRRKKLLFFVFNKIDLLTNDEFKEIQKIYEDLGIKTFQISAKLRTNIDVLKEYLLKKTAIFVGNSGSGKSTLTSAITGKKILSKALSNNQGVHTTSLSTLYNINEMQIIDSPGVRDIDIDHLKLKEITLGFPEIMHHSLNCVFPNCSHQIDDGCAVKTAMKNGDIKESRYNNFIFLSNQEKIR